jgi:hypothetical protein
VAVVDIGLLGGRGDTQDLGAARRQLPQHHGARSTEEDGAQVTAQLVEVLVAQHAALLVDNPMPVEETERGSQLPGIDELDHRVQLIQPVFKGSAREHEGEGRGEAFDDAGGLCLPVFNPLSLVQDDEVPSRPLDGGEVPQHLLVVAHRIERATLVHFRALARPARWISDAHCDLTDAGQTTSTREIPTSWARSSAIPMPCMVLPRPMSSAIIALPAPTAKAMPSIW